ncbi:exosortase/archaeosortase family protein [Oerskovia sp. Root22]|uniref:exosortase/archaeosortase family protein n=1 Tax=Oerskovia sp. Root22 TaxID=1736494 RepID=UPI00138EDC04|nr:exosortase/archaeosortase family protein [Oerskovia sp. Root22]
MVKVQAERGSNLLGARLCAAVFVVLAVVPFVLNEPVRRVEAAVVGWVAQGVLGVDVTLAPVGAVLGVGAGTQSYFQMTVSMACSVVLLTAPLFALAAVLLATGRAPVRRGVLAAALGAVGLELTNTVRLVLIMWMTRRTGLEGFGWAHTVYGSLIVLAGLILVILAFVLVATGRRRARRVAPRSPRLRDGGGGGPRA